MIIDWYFIHSANVILSGLTVLPHEDLYLENIPDQDQYEVSYNHRDTVTHMVVTK
jgi:hypothetical protein